MWDRLLSNNALAYLLHPTLCLVNFVDRDVKYRKSTMLVYASIGYETLLLMPCRLLNTFVCKFGFRYILDCVLLNLAYRYWREKNDEISAAGESQNVT